MRVLVTLADDELGNDVASIKPRSRSSRIRFLAAIGLIYLKNNPSKTLDGNGHEVQNTQSKPKSKNNAEKNNEDSLSKKGILNDWSQLS